MLDAARDDAELTRSERHDPIPKVDVELSGQDEKELILSHVMVPDEFPLDPGSGPVRPWLCR